MVLKEFMLLILLVTYPPRAMNIELGGLFYDGNRPSSFTLSMSYSGIKMNYFEGLYDVDLCINIYSGGNHTCSGKCGSWMNNVDCSCDQGCYLYNDCCPDYEIFCVDDWLPATEDLSETTDVITSMAIQNTTEEIPGSPETSDYEVETTTAQTTPSPSWYVERQNRFFDSMDMVRNNIAQIVRNRRVSENITETCFNSFVTPKVSYYMVTTCPEDSPKEEQERCSNLSWSRVDSVVPVYSYSDGLFYANKFCAACHSHSNEFSLAYLTLSCEWSCDQYQSPNMKDAPTSFSTCRESTCFSLKWLFDPPPRPCIHKEVRKCPMVDDLLSKVCDSYSAPVYGGNELDPTIYKNAHCAYCNGINKTWIQCWGKAPRGPVRAVPLTILFDFSSGALQQSQVYGGPPPPLDCPKYFIYDRIRYNCRRVACPYGAIFQNLQCVYAKDPSNIKNRTLSGTLDPLYRRIITKLATNDDNFTDEQVLKHLNTFWNYYQSIEYYYIKKYNRNQIAGEDIGINWDGQLWMKSKNVAPQEDCLDNYTIGITVTLEGKEHSWSRNIEDGIYRIQKWLEGQPSCNPGMGLGFVLISATYANFPYVSQLCNDSAQVPKVYGGKSFARMSIGSTYMIEMNFPGNNTEMYESIKIPQEAVFTGGKMYWNSDNMKKGNWSRMDRVYFCEGFPLCPLITLIKQEYQWQFHADDKASLVLLESGRKVPHDEILLTYDGMVQICLHFDDPYKNKTSSMYSRGQSIATTIGCVISLTLLALVIITYCSFPTLRNVPGKTVLNLSISLFLAQLLLLAGAGQTTNTIVCLIIACVMHLFWLAVFTSTNILAFDLGQTFGAKSGVRGNDIGGAMFIKYLIYGWGVPLVIVGITILFHFFQAADGAKENIYGVTSACWLRSGYPLLIAFGIPVAFALVMNVTFFTRTILGIRATMKMTKILKKDHEGDQDSLFLKKELYLYMRLSISIGLTWMSGFVVPYTEVPELGYIFIILNSFQGPVIFLSFICSRRVMKLWKAKICNSFHSTAATSRSINDLSDIGKTKQTQIRHGRTHTNTNV